MRIIGHIDMDAFFAAVEERDKPRLRGKPIVVGADPVGGRGRGVVSTANYKARAYGIHSAVPISRAWQLAENARKDGKPAAVFVSPDFKRYSETSERIMTILRAFVPRIEKRSIDEAYLDLSSSGSYAHATALMRKIKQEVLTKEHLTASVGIGPNKLVAKIASDMRKPDGLTVVPFEQSEKFLSPLPIRVIPGIGPKTEALFKAKGVYRVADLQKISCDEMHALVGKWGLDFYENARGRDRSPITEHEEAKSIGEQETFSRDTKDPNALRELLSSLAETTMRRLEAGGFHAFGRIVLMVRFSDFETHTQSRTFPKPQNDKKTLEFEALKLLMPFLDKRKNPRGKPIRLVGVRIEKLH